MVFSIVFMMVGAAMLLGLVIALVVVAIFLAKRYGAVAIVPFVALLLLLPVAFALLALVPAQSRMVPANTPVPMTQRSADADWPGAPPVTPSAPVTSQPSIQTQIVGEIREEELQTAEFKSGTLPDVQVSAQPDAPAAAWASKELEAFEASLYPGIVHCGAPLARTIAQLIQQKQLLPTDIKDDTESSSPIFSVFGDSSLGDRKDAFVNQFMDELARSFPDSQVVQSDTKIGISPTPGGPLAQTVTVSLTASFEKIERLSFGRSKRDPQGEVACQVASARGTADARLQFVEKPWVHGFDQLVSASPEKQFVIGYSAKLASSEVEARQLAMENAQSQVRITSRSGYQTLLNDSHVIDRFAQKLSRPYGDVWREAVLVDVTSKAMRGTIVATNARADQAHAVKQSMTMTATLLLLCTIAVCFVANALTQGYYRQPIRWGAGAIGALVIVVGIIFLGNVT